MSREIDLERFKRAEAAAELNAAVEILGDLISEHRGYGSDVKGEDAIVAHLAEMHHWLPRDVRTMDRADLRIVLASEFKQYALELERRLKNVQQD